ASAAAKSRKHTRSRCSPGVSRRGKLAPGCWWSATAAFSRPSVPSGRIRRCCVTSRERERRRTDALLHVFDARRLTRQLAEIVEPRATHLAVRQDLDPVDPG